MTRVVVSEPKLDGVFVAGTDTGVGKTLIACALVHLMRRQGWRPVPMKPVASGCVPGPEGLVNEDVEALLAASACGLTADDIAPYRFEPAIAPHIAAAEAGVLVDHAILCERAERLAQHGPLVVEGAGGWLVPTGADATLADLAAALGLPVVLVVGLRLGCLNHALLSAASIAAHGLTLAGWVANNIDPAFERAEANLDSLRARLPAPCLGVVPYQPGPDAAAIQLQLPVGLQRLTSASGREV